LEAGPLAGFWGFGSGGKLSSKLGLRGENGLMESRDCGVCGVGDAN